MKLTHGRLTLLLVFCGVVIAAVPPAGAQTPPVTVPAESQLAGDDANLALKKGLDKRYEVLLRQFNTWNTEATAFNDKYGGKNLEADTQEAKAGQAEQARLSQALEVYERDNIQFKNLVGRLHPKMPEIAPTAANVEPDPESVRVINGIKALAIRLGWSTEKQARLEAALNKLDFGGNPNPAGLIRSLWRTIATRSQDSDLVQEASQDGGLGFPGAGKQSFNDCAIFALANATGQPYEVVAARATLLISQGGWRPAPDRAQPQTTLEQNGLNGGELIMLAESFGQAEVVTSSEFSKTLKAGRPIMVNLALSNGHEVVLTKTFQHGGETWYVMMDSNQNPDQRRFLSAKEMNTVLAENGVVYHPEPGTTPNLLRQANNH